LTNESFYSSYIKGERSLAEDIFIKLTIIFRLLFAGKTDRSGKKGQKS
jgi:hypothetical protein